MRIRENSPPRIAPRLPTDLWRQVADVLDPSERLALSQTRLPPRELLPIMLAPTAPLDRVLRHAPAGLPLWGAQSHVHRTLQWLDRVARLAAPGAAPLLGAALFLLWDRDVVAPAALAAAEGAMAYLVARSVAPFSVLMLFAGLARPCAVGLAGDGDMGFVMVVNLIAVMAVASAAQFFRGAAPPGNWTFALPILHTSAFVGAIRLGSAHHVLTLTGVQARAWMALHIFQLGFEASLGRCDAAHRHYLTSLLPDPHRDAGSPPMQEWSSGELRACATARGATAAALERLIADSAAEPRSAWTAARFSMLVASVCCARAPVRPLLRDDQVASEATLARAQARAAWE